MARRVRHFAAERLSDEAQAIVRRALQANRPAEDICAEVERATGEKLAASSLKRYRATQWTAEQEALRRAREHARELVEVAREFRDIDDADLMRQLLAARLQELGASAFADADPIALLKEQRQAEALRIDRERLDLDRKKVVLDERLVQIQREKLDLAKALAAAKDAAAQAAKKLEQASASGRSVPPDVLARIARDLYGIGEAVPAAGEATPADLG